MATGQAGTKDEAAFDAYVEETALRRELGLKECTSLVVGDVIGSGIFITPGIVGAALGASMEIMLIWLVCGFIVLCGALSVAELGSMMPRSGGRYLYYREAYGPLFGFLYVWVGLLITGPASVAALSIGFAQYIAFFIDASHPEILGIAITTICTLTVINYYGVRYGGFVQTLLTALKVLALALLIGAAFLSPEGSGAHLTPYWRHDSVLDILVLFGAIMGPVLFSFDGWTDVTEVGGEIKNPRRTLPLSLALGMVFVVIVYLLANAAYMYVIPAQEMAGTARIASEVSARMFGSVGATVFSIAVLISIFGATNGLILSQPRLYYALAADPLMGSRPIRRHGPIRWIAGAFHALFHWLAGIHATHKTPAAALLFQAVVSSIVVVIGEGFEAIVTYLAFTQWLFYLLAAGAVFVLRRKRPDVDRPYKAWGYPFSTGIFILVATGFLITTIAVNRIEALAGLSLVATGLPAYWLWRRR